MYMLIHHVNYVYFFPVTCAVDVVVQWCSQGDLLAVAGMERTPLSPDPSCPPPTRNAIVKFYNVRGEHIYTLDTPAQVINVFRVFVLLHSIYFSPLLYWNTGIRLFVK